MSTLNRHVHERSNEGDRCAACGRDLRDTIHLRADEPVGWVYIPDDLRESLLRYAEHHIPTGGFLAAVLANDLFEAYGRASENNTPIIPALCRWIYNTLPAPCWGSREKVAAWLDAGRVAS